MCMCVHVRACMCLCVYYRCMNGYMDAGLNGWWISCISVYFLYSNITGSGNWFRPVEPIVCCTLSLTSRYSQNTSMFCVPTSLYLLLHFTQPSTVKSAGFGNHIVHSKRSHIWCRFRKEGNVLLWCTYNEWMNEWMFNDTPARKTDRLLGHS